MTKKKLLVLIEWFAPGYKAGGPIQSCVNFAYALKDDFDIYVLTTDTDHGETEPYPNVIADQWMEYKKDGFKIYYAKRKSLSRNKLKQAMVEVGADYIYLNLLFSPYFSVYPLWLKYMGKLKGEVVLCPRGTLYDSALAVKPYKKKPFIQLFRSLGINKKILFHATNEREKEAVQRFFPGSRVLIADNLPNSNQRPFASCEKSPGSLKCIFIARIVAIKNLLFLIEVLTKLKSNVELTVIGPSEDKEYWMECEKKIAQLPTNIQVNYLGAKRNDELADIIGKHHLFVLPTAGENFGHSIFESLLCGRPVLISDQTPWLHLQEKKIGWDLPLNQPEKFQQAMEEAAQWDQASFDEWASSSWEYAKKFISNPGLHSEYMQLFT